MVMYCDICGAKIENGDKATECPRCLCSFENVDKFSPIKEYKSKVPHGMIIKKISTDESFMNAMVELYKNDPIEYQLKIQQFKVLRQQQKNIKREEEEQQKTNIPHCPTCNSTDIKRIPEKVRSSAAWTLGAAVDFVGKTFECQNCGYTW